MNDKEKKTDQKIFSYRDYTELINGIIDSFTILVKNLRDEDTLNSRDIYQITCSVLNLTNELVEYVFKTEDSDEE